MTTELDLEALLSLTEDEQPEALDEAAAILVEWLNRAASEAPPLYVWSVLIDEPFVYRRWLV